MTTYIEMLLTLPNDGGITLKRGNPVNYKSGWQL